MKKYFIAIVSAIALLAVSFGNVFASENKEFNLIDYLENNDVTSRSELNDVIEMNTRNSSMTALMQSLTYVNDQNVQEVEFSYSIDYENQTIEVDTVYQSAVSAYTTTGTASHEVLSVVGTTIYTVSVTGTFTRNMQTCAASSASGSFQPSSLSTWSSTPTISRGGLSRTQAYARIAGTARSGLLTKNYNLTLICDVSGALSSTFSD